MKPDIRPVYTQVQLEKAWRDRGYNSPAPVEEWMLAIHGGRTDVLTARVGNMTRGTVNIRWLGVRPDEPTVIERLAAKYPGVEPIPTIYDLWVEENYRRKGIGRALMEFAEQRVKIRPSAIQALALSVEDDEDHFPARELYGNMGYEIVQFGDEDTVKMIVPLPNDSGGFDAMDVSAYVMTKDLSKPDRLENT